MHRPVRISVRPTSPPLLLAAALIFSFGLVLLISPSAATATTYKVRSRDTLSEIASANRTTPEALMKLNGITDPRKLQVGQVLRLPQAPGAGTAARPPVPVTPPAVPGGMASYTVRKGDTLDEIAKRHGTTVAGLLAANSIANPNDLDIGQVIKVPSVRTGSPSGGSAPAPAPAGAVVPAGVPPEMKKALSRIRINAAKWKQIVLHHSAAPRGSLAGMDAYHRERGMENGLAYHFVIGNGRGMGDGQLGVSTRWEKQLHGGHLASAAMNQVAIGICLVGDFEASRPTASQMTTLRGLLTFLRASTRVPAARIQMHRTINIKPTACPGKLFPMTTIGGWLK